MRFLINQLGRAESVLRKAKNSLLRRSDNHFNMMERWYREDPGGLKRITFDFLHEDSIVLDLGGYKGEWTSDIFARYQPTIHIFEPVTAYATLIRERFASNRKITVHAAGLASADRTTYISINQFQSKLTPSADATPNTEQIRLIGIDDFLTTYGIEHIDLVKINIEGAEYELLEYMIGSGLLKKIDALLIQFHNWEPEAEKRRKAIQECLRDQFTAVFDYPFIWEYWKRKL